MLRSILLTVALAAVVAPVGVRAEIALRRKDELLSDSTHIVRCKVNAIYATEERDAKWSRHHGVVELEVIDVEKGEGLQKGDAIYPRFWTQRWIGKGLPPPYGSGHDVPEKGQTIRAYLERHAGGYNALLPNWVEVDAKPAASKTK
jgi:hypothetical protein